MSAPTEQDVEELAQVLQRAQGPWTPDQLARALIKSDWYSERIADAEARGAAPLVSKIKALALKYSSSRLETTAADLRAVLREPTP